MERREALRNIGLTFGAFVATPTAVSLLQSCQTETPWHPGFYTQNEGRAIRKLVDVMLPAVDDLPSATGVNVHVFIDKYVKEVMEIKDQQIHQESLQILMADLLKVAGEDEIGDLSDSDYAQYLDANLRKSKEEDEAIRQQLNEHLAKNDGDPMGLADNVRAYAYLAGLRSMAIWAYKINEQIGENVMAYKPVPGEQEGCVDLQEATGGKAWSL